MRKWLFIAVAFFLLVPGGISAFPSIPESIRVTEWKVLYMQKDSLAAARYRGGWKKLEIPSKFKYPYPPRRDFQHAWLRGTFVIRDDPRKYYGITIGRIQYTYKIFINDYLIDVKTPEEIGNMQYPEGFNIPRGILQRGKNNIYIYLGIYGMEYGGLPDGVYIQPKIEYRKLKNFLDLMFNQLPIGILLLLIGSILLMIAVSIFYGTDRLFVYEILVQLLNALYIITIFSPYKLFGRDLISSMLMIAIPLFGILFILIIESLYRIKLHEYNWIAFLMVLVVSGMVLIASRFILNFYINPVYSMLLIFIFVPYAAYLAWRTNAMRPDRFKFIAILVLVFLLSAGGLLEIIFYLIGSRYSLLIVTYFSPFAILGFAVLGSREYQKRMFSLKTLYNRIHVGEKKIDTIRKKVITVTTEEKLKSIITFIGENFTSDISREGLAAAVGMNPNYFSGQFREYTGKKINDFINELRVHDAIERLRDPEAKIIDVALATGFDSLSTFNRAFRHVTGQTPTEYRKK
ncbi:MAG TPA: AraC family transcriptional regulator [Spirochaetota bacterium]|nr:helix-turn-helix domain-containing protein [Spirochaetota bacterium]HOD14321.1 AraC family transcriptional regulator [Spirochaetota bacterium]HPG52016.1 AraC family transcriptional regulator [Spirochaetota bacterium]HPN11760.1 AraC family transcriptional regulator [Spirochaetota bacterium]